MNPSFFIDSKWLYIWYLLQTSDEHLNFMVTLYNTPEFIASFGSGKCTTPEDVRSLLIGRFQNEHTRNGYGPYLISLKPGLEASLAESTPVGVVSLMRGGPPNCYTVPDLGFTVHPKYTRRGIASEEAQLLLSYAGRESGVKEVIGLYDLINGVSKRAFQKLGFEDRGLKTLRVFGGVVGHD